MKLNAFGVNLPTRAATATLVLVLFCVLGGVPVQATVPDVGYSDGDGGAGKISDPLFAFLLALAYGDSLGIWTGEDIKNFALDMGGGSKFPLDLVASIRRRRPSEGESSRWPDVTLIAMWELKLVHDMDRPMPYSILGYHPGSLRVTADLVMSELSLGDVTFLTKDGAEARSRHLKAIKALRLDVGSVVLDADAIPDALLGGNLDDAWTLGFVLTREGDRQVGLVVSVKRDGGAIYGELDFVNDEIMPSGSLLGGQLSKLCRGWFNRPGSHPPKTWVGE